MKKAITIILAFSLVLLLAACSGNSNNSGGNTNTPSNSGTTTQPARSQPSSTPTVAAPTTPDLGNLIGGNTIISDADAVARQNLIDQARREGGDLEFHADGTMVYTDADGSLTIQKPDGTWEYRSPDGESASVQFGGNWPENEFTRLMPKPDFDFLAAVETDGEYVVAFVNPTIDQIKAYVEEVKKAGFNISEDLSDMAVAGMVMYTYTAKNSAGYEVTVASITGASSLTISKP